jgi:hypothetical protein
MYIVKWIVENRIVLFQADGDQTVESVTEGFNHLQEFISKGQAPVHVISDARYLGKFPTSFKSLKMGLFKHEKSGYAVSIGGNILSKFVSTMMARLSDGSQLVLKDSFADAFYFLKTVDTSLPRAIEYEDSPPQKISDAHRDA